MDKSVICKQIHDYKIYNGVKFTPLDVTMFTIYLTTFAYGGLQHRIVRTQQRTERDVEGTSRNMILSNVLTDMLCGLRRQRKPTFMIADLRVEI
jgi:hypothetical protein